MTEKQKKMPPRLTPEDREARQGLMLAQKLSGKYVSQIAKAFGVSQDVVYSELKEAQRKQLHTKAVAYISYNLMPKALAVFAAALDKGDKDIAIRVLEGLGILGKGNQPGMLQINLGGDDVSAETFEAFRVNLIRKGTPSLPSAREEVLEGRVVGGSDEGRGTEGSAETRAASDGTSPGEGRVDGAGGE